MKIFKRTRNFHSIAVWCQTAAVSFRSVSGNGEWAGKPSAYSHRIAKGWPTWQRHRLQMIVFFRSGNEIPSNGTAVPLSPHVSLSQHTMHMEKSRNASTNPSTNLSLQMTSANMLTHWICECSVFLLPRTLRATLPWRPW
jgi:hypothetical protein